MIQTERIVSSMSNEGRNTYVVEHLTNALLELLNEKPIHDISISELVNRAGVGRASFYRNYECKEDILKHLLNEKTAEWGGDWDENSGAPLSEHIRTMLKHFEANRAFYKLLNDRGLIYLLKDVIVEFLGPKPEHDMISAYSSAFAAYVLYGWIDTWFQRGMKESADEIADMFKAQNL